MTAILFGLVASILYGIGAAVQQHQAAQAPGTTAGRPRLLVHLARQPLWVAGGVAQVVGFILHAVALRFGALAIVQSTLTGNTARGGNGGVFTAVTSYGGGGSSAYNGGNGSAFGANNGGGGGAREGSKRVRRSP